MLRKTPTLRLLVLVALSFFMQSCDRQTIFDDARQDYIHHHYTRAFAKTLKCAKQGDPRAQYALGNMYYYGTGTVKEPDLARYWIRCAAKSKYQPAVVALEIITKARYDQYSPAANIAGKSMRTSDRVPDRYYNARAKQLKPTAARQRVVQKSNGLSERYLNAGNMRSRGQQQPNVSSTSSAPAGATKKVSVKSEPKPVQQVAEVTKRPKDDRVAAAPTTQLANAQPAVKPQPMTETKTQTIAQKTAPVSVTPALAPAPKPQAIVAKASARVLPQHHDKPKSSPTIAHASTKSTHKHSRVTARAHRHHNVPRHHASAVKPKHKPPVHVAKSSSATFEHPKAVATKPKPKKQEYHLSTLISQFFTPKMHRQPEKKMALAPAKVTPRHSGETHHAQPTKSMPVMTAKVNKPATQNEIVYRSFTANTPKVIHKPAPKTEIVYSTFAPTPKLVTAVKPTPKTEVVYTQFVANKAPVAKPVSHPQIVYTSFSANPPKIAKVTLPAKKTEIVYSTFTANKPVVAKSKPKPKLEVVYSQFKPNTSQAIKVEHHSQNPFNQKSHPLIASARVIHHPAPHHPSVSKKPVVKHVTPKVMAHHKSKQHQHVVPHTVVAHKKPMTTPSRGFIDLGKDGFTKDPLYVASLPIKTHKPSKADFRPNPYMWATLQDPDDYTIQLTIAKDSKKIKALAKLHLPDYKVVPYKFHVGKKTKYSITCGSFKSYQQAQKLIAALPNEAKEHAEIYKWKRLQPSMEPYV